MEDYKIRFSLVNLFFQTQKEVARVQTMFKGLSMAAVSTTWYNTDPRHALYVAGIGFAIDLFLACIWLEKK